MCGIFAYLNYHVPRTRREILETLIKGLQRLEYRGYDSADLSPKLYSRPPTSFFLDRP
uniref:glutamine--fructose-6-phosphate transaminase (isomerizing) n=1 Tax=Homo sapiens TaxID=9606 RepID=A0A6I8PRT6_HUMAN